MPTGASSIAGSPPMSIGACPTISLLTRSIRPLAFDTMRPVASSTRSAYVSILPRLVFCARVAVVRAAGGFARARETLRSAGAFVGGPLAIGAWAAPAEGACSGRGASVEGSSVVAPGEEDASGVFDQRDCSRAATG